MLLIAAVCAAPVVLGWGAYLMGWAPGDRSNYGELLEPRPVSGPPLDALRGKWVLVTFDGSACDAYCERKLYFMRQVRRAQGENRIRVARLWVVTDDGAPRERLLHAIEGTRIARLPEIASVSAFTGRPPDHIYLVDPLGNLMMRYPRDPDPSGMLKDLQRLLKYSSAG